MLFSICYWPWNSFRAQRYIARSEIGWLCYAVSFAKSIFNTRSEG